MLTNVPVAQAALADPTAAYGTLGANDSWAYGTPIAFTKFGFQIIGPGATAGGWTVGVYGTIDKDAYALYSQAYATTGVGTFGAAQPTGEPFKTIPATSWALLPALAVQTGTGGESNPMVSGPGGAIVFVGGGPLVAIRICIIGASSPAGVISVDGFAVP
jgi:hypothetical protein